MRTPKMAVKRGEIMEFGPFRMTQAGRELVAKAVGGVRGVKLQSIALSDTIYSDADIEALTELGGIRQTIGILSRVVQNKTSVAVEGTAYNSSLSEGYDINTIGIVAQDENGTEALYAVARAVTPGYMPPYGGNTVYAVSLRCVVSVGNPDRLDVTLSPPSGINAIVITNTDPGEGTRVSYPDGTVIHVYE